MSKLKQSSIIFIVVSVFILVQLIGTGIFDLVRVNERQVAVITRFGRVIDVKNAGWHFKVPWIDSLAATYDTSVQSVSANASSATKDQQTVDIKANIQYRIDPTKAREIFQLVQSQKFLNESIVPPFIQEAVKATISEYTAGELLEKRDVVKVGIEERLQERLDGYYSTVVAVNIENIDWSDEFDKAIEQKVIAEQEVLRKQQELEQAKILAEIQITEATAEAEATRIRGSAIRENPETLEKAKIDKWDGKLPRVQGDNDVIIDLPSE